MRALMIANANLKAIIIDSYRYFSCLFAVLLMLSILVSVPTASAQVPYTPEAEYNCDESLSLDVHPNSWYEGIIFCTISNDNVHEIKVKISTEWDYFSEGPYGTSEWGYCETNSAIGDEISVTGNTDYTICFTIDADSHVTEGEHLFSTSMEIVSYSNGIPCDDCEPVEEEVTVNVLPWFALEYETTSSPEGAYDWYGTRTECQKVDSNTITITVNVDGNFINTLYATIEFDYRFRAYDLDNDEEYVAYTKSKFGAIDLVYYPTIEMFVGETYSTTLSASWNIPEDTSNYDMDLRTQINFYAGFEESTPYSGGYYWDHIRLEDYCDWEGVETAEQAPTGDNQPEQSGLTLSLGNSYSGLLAISSVVFAALMARRR